LERGALRFSRGFKAESPWRYVANVWEPSARALCGDSRPLAIRKTPQPVAEWPCSLMYRFLRIGERALRREHQLKTMCEQNQGIGRRPCTNRIKITTIAITNST
jgi:hypothetical protein